MRLKAGIFAGLALGALAACSPQAAERAGTAAIASDAARHPESGLAIIALTVTGKAGRRHAFRVELAESQMEQAKGLMFRTAMGVDEGMLFPMSPPRRASFWMKNTVIPLDIIFIGGDRRILNIAANTVPYSEDHVLSEGTAHSVLELNAGRAAELGIAAGDTVDW